MSSEKNPEVVGCDASIMKNVWEIRVREYNQKMLLEQERLERSALPSINKDWANRMTPKTGGYKGVERKVKPDDTQTDNNFWKSKQPLIPQTVPQSKGPLVRPGIQAKRSSTPASTFKDKKSQDKSFNRLKQLMFITETQPSSLVWGKAWKYNKSLQAPAEGSTLSSDWGQSWMFATHQPHAEEGKPRPNESNQEDLLSFHLWRQPDHKLVESRELNTNPPSEEWRTSWKRSDQIKKDESVTGEKVSKLGIFASLVETQHHNETLCLSEWNDSWQNTKSTNQQDRCTFPNESLMNVFDDKKPEKERQMSSDWEECWRLLNHHGSTKSKLSQIQTSHSPEWVVSWRTTLVFNNRQGSDPSQNQDHSCGTDYHSQHRESHFNEILHASLRQHRRFHLQFCNTSETEWNESWRTVKNNSKPCEEIDKVLTALPPKTGVVFEPQNVEKNPKVHYSTENTEPLHDVIYQTKREFTQSKLPLLEHLQKLLPPAEWRDSWKTIKHRRRLERRKYGPEPLKPLKESGEDVKPHVSEWKDSWKCICLPLNQEPELWQQGWSTSTQIRLNWERHQNCFSLVEFPKNGPFRERIWGESWKFSRHQHHLEPGQSLEQTGKEKSSGSSPHPGISQERENLPRSISDWQDAWMVSENPLHHDKPSFSQWRESWKWSIYHTLTWTGPVPVDKWLNESMEIQHTKKMISVQRAETKESDQTFGSRFPERDWSSSWSSGSRLHSQPEGHDPSAKSEQSKINLTQQQQTAVSEYGCQWGRSFRIANPMPHLEQPWLESCPSPGPSPGSYSVLWSRGNKIQNDIKSNLKKNSVVSMFWENSHQFLQNANGQFKNKHKSKESKDLRRILTKKIQTKKHLYTSMEKEKLERKWAGSHLLGKTQPRPKRGSVNNKLTVEDHAEDKLFEGWMESWRYLVLPESLKKQIRLKMFSGWDESWKFLLPSY